MIFFEHMSNHSVTVDSKAIKSILEEMEFYRRGIANLRKKLLKILPEEMLSYGSDLWWEKSEFEADMDIKKGNISKKYAEMDELLTDLQKGKLKRT